MVVKGQFRPMHQKRIIVYIDGFNLYFGLREQQWRKFMWLDLPKFAAGLTLPGQTLVTTKYFTSRVSGHVGKQKRQSSYLDALDTLPGLQIFYGQYQSHEEQCQKCGFRVLVPNEKKTDVNIATEMMTDAFQDNCDTLILVSADSDLTGPLEAISKLFPDKSLVVAFPPKRFSVELQKLATGCLYLKQGKFQNCQLSDKVKTKSGFVVERPEKWR